LREHAGNISAVARTLGKARVQIQRWVKRYGLDPESFRA
jgi:transposase-like protein